jgi:hypothetical protein
VVADDLVWINQQLEIPIEIERDICIRQDPM